MKVAPRTGFAFGAYISPMIIHHPLHYGQPYAAAAVFHFAMQALKHLKYFFGILLFETYTIIPYFY